MGEAGPFSFLGCDACVILASLLATEGAGRSRFDVGPDGAVLGIKIFKTTGSAKLDSASLTALRACRFAPGSEEGKAARTTALLEVEWKPGAEPKVFAFDIYARWRKRP